MDCQMPEMDGYAATAAIRTGESGERRIPIVAMTAHAMEGDRERCVDAGMDGYLSKPMRREQLIDALRQWISPQTNNAAVDGGPPNSRVGVADNRELEAGAAANASSATGRTAAEGALVQAPVP
jgi:two-component system sensor histidine kinase/response regulator